MLAPFKAHLKHFNIEHTFKALKAKIPHKTHGVKKQAYAGA